jgi:NitT/TauT family transport system permease protein
VIINVCAGVRSVREDLREMALSYGASRAQVTFLVLIPSAMPLVMAGVRVGAGRAVKGMINGEMFVALSGLGFLVATAGARYDVESVLAVMLVVIAVAVAVGAVASRLDKRLTRWVASTHR